MLNLPITPNYVIPAIVAETGEKVMVNNPSPDNDNPWGFYTGMWHSTENGHIYHDDELIFNGPKLDMTARADLKSDHNRTGDL